MKERDLFKRTRQFHIYVLKLCRHLPKDPAGWETGKQVIRSAGSVGANYRATKRAKSDPDYHNKIKVVLEEADESEYWLGVISESGMVSGPEIDRLIQEAGELTAIFSASDKTLRRKLYGEE
ncbi:four helix bundle protein [Flaviaesturariibacter aridisoli]|uniref:Four helix bundle protein n=1 Tax=Flaviaesturariibacter aridisoli TaxID=2545761 RepID=A0A4R4E2Z9_9BACT|nr:four helix bundle protein [Flaviaesturariibacter aridisoli]TCZ71411.1 four helix bundle protein [Flaviaesturariibacter aridisoli]